VVSCIPAVAFWHDSDRVKRPPVAVAAVAVAAAAAVAAVAVVAETVACTAPLSAPCYKTATQSIQSGVIKTESGPTSVPDPYVLGHLGSGSVSRRYVSKQK
jgi:hypothetical protein